MPEITKKIIDLAQALDSMIEHLQQDAAVVMAAGKEIKDSLKKEDKGEDKDPA